jgi:hypothetical protein
MTNLVVAQREWQLVLKDPKKRENNKYFENLSPTERVDCLRSFLDQYEPSISHDNKIYLAVKMTDNSNLRQYCMFTVDLADIEWFDEDTIIQPLDGRQELPLGKHFEFISGKDKKYSVYERMGLACLKPYSSKQIQYGVVPIISFWDPDIYERVLVPKLQKERGDLTASPVTADLVPHFADMGMSSPLSESTYTTTTVSPLTIQDSLATRIPPRQEETTPSSKRVKYDLPIGLFPFNTQAVGIEKKLPAFLDKEIANYNKLIEEYKLEISKCEKLKEHIANWDSGTGKGV